MAVDTVAAEVFSALGQAGVSAVLLKGPAIVRWLYPPGGERIYADVDILVSPDAFARAAQVIAALGFSRFQYTGVHQIPHADTWQRERDGGLVDLHRNLLGVGADGREAWSVLTRRTESMCVAGVELQVLGRPARLLHIALHAAQHGVRAQRTLTDLSLALEQAPEGTWLAAAAMAGQLDAVEGFAAGLRLLPTGRALAERLELPRRGSVEVALRANTAPPVALGIDRLHRTNGPLAKLELIARKVVPNPAFMRAWSSLARRGHVGLLAAYLWRPVWLLWRLAPAVQAWRSARHRAK